MTKEETRRIDCPLKDFPDTYVVIPKHWRGKHCIKRDQAIIASKEYGSIEMTNLSISLHLAIERGNIPGVEGDDPTKWDMGETPVSIIIWLSAAVVDDFSSAYDVPKNF